MVMGQGSEDDSNKMIVETELVKTENAKILPVSQQVMKPYQNAESGEADVATLKPSQGKGLSNGSEMQGPSSNKDSTAAVDKTDAKEDVNATIKPLQAQNRIASLQLQESGNNNSNQFSEKESTPATSMMTHSHTNPLSTHVSAAGGLKNKKSSLLIDCAGDQTTDFSHGSTLNSADQMLDLSLASKDSSQELHSFVQMVPGLSGQKQKPRLNRLMSYQEESSEGKIDSDSQVSYSQESKPFDRDRRVGVRTPNTPPPPHGKVLSQTSLVSKDGGVGVLSGLVQQAQQKQYQNQLQSLQQPQPQQLEDRQKSQLFMENERNQANPSVSNMTSTPQLATSVTTDAESVRKLNKDSSSKADFFAARLATAVGENEISDSEETFVYQSTANSIKNAATTESSVTPNNTMGSVQHNPAKGYGIPAKLSAPQLKQNDKLLNRLKNTRHTSIAAIPNSQGPPSSNSEKDEIASLRSLNRNSMQEIQSIKSHRTQMSSSPKKRLSVASLQKKQSRQQQPPQANKVFPPKAANSTTPTRGTFGTLSKKTVNPISNQNKSSKQVFPQPMLPLTQGAVMQQPYHHRRNPSNQGNRNKNALRTRSSKVFDPNGSSLRRYSGVPDDVNLEDFVDQYDGDIDMSISKQSRPTGKQFNANLQGNSNIHRNPPIGDKTGQFDQDDNNSDFAGDDAEGNDIDTDSGVSGMHDLGYNDQTNYDELSYADEDQDDVHSMFYYNGENLGLPSNRVGRRFSELDEFGGEDVESQGFYYTEANHPGQSTNVQKPTATHQQFFSQPSEYTPLKNKAVNRKRSNFHGDFSPHNFYTKKSSWAKVRNFIYFSFIVTSLLMVGFVSGFLLATNKELHDFQVLTMDNVLVSLDELVFDITATAFNPGLFTIGIKTVELDIFAKTNHLDTSKDNDMLYNAPYQTVLLGTVLSLETELQFRGRLINRNYDVSIASVKLLNPGAPKNSDDDDDDDGDDSDGSGNHKLENDIDRWKELIKYDFELIIRGNMYYTIPFFSSEKVIPVQHHIIVDPDKSLSRKHGQNRRLIT